MGLLDGKHIVITGVLTDASIAFGVAKLAQEEGAEIVLTGAGRGLSLTERTARKLPGTGPVFELDVTDPAHLVSARDAVADRWDRVDGVLHAIGFAPAICLGGTFMEATWEDVGVALNVSAYSLKALVDAFGPLMRAGGSLVGLDFDATVAWPAYDWMGVAKAALESTARYLARELGRPGHPGEPGGGRTDPDHGRQVDPRLRGVRGRMGGPGPARLGHQRHRARGTSVRRRCCRTGSPPPPARWSTSTAAITPSGPEGASGAWWVLPSRTSAEAFRGVLASFRKPQPGSITSELFWPARARRRRPPGPPAAQPTIEPCPAQYGLGARASGSCRSRSSAARPRS